MDGRSPAQRRQSRSASPERAAEQLVGQGMSAGNGAALIATASDGTCALIRCISRPTIAHQKAEPDASF